MNTEISSESRRQTLTLKFIPICREIPKNQQLLKKISWNNEKLLGTSK
jgi:hypothetical protein